MKTLHLDFETKSRVNMKKVGIDNYAHDESTGVLMLAYAFDDQEVGLWEPRLGPMPEDLMAALLDPTVVKKAWNAAFEIAIFQHVLKIDLIVDQWVDVQAHSRYLGLSGYLDQMGDLLQIDQAYTKSKEGKALLKLFSEPTKAKKPTKKNPAGVPSVFNDWESHPTEWVMLCNYCMQDVVAERKVENILDTRAVFPESEKKLWVLDHRINQRGIPIDLDYVAKAFDLVESERTALTYESKTITGCENPNSPAQMKQWLAGEGLEAPSLNKAVVTEFLSHALLDLSPDVRKALELKQLMGGIAFTKLPVIQRWTREDRLRMAFVYHSAHTGRWASRGVQFHNLLRPTKRVSENYDAIINWIKHGGNVPADLPVVEAISGALRGSVRASEGKQLYVADFSSIENRVLAWLAQCPGMLDVFNQGLDPYKSFAVKFYNLPYDQITKEQRNFCKSPVLGAGFGMGGIRLVGYAKGMGQVISEDEAIDLVKAWRKAYPEVVKYWDLLGDSCVKAVTLKQHLQLGPIQLDGRDEKMFHIILPSGRMLNYEAPEIGRGMYGKMVLKHMVYEKYWHTQEARGSFLVENVVQAIARDLLVNGMWNVEAAGFEIVLHVHDELVAEVANDSPLTYEHFEHCMTINPPWALDLPLKVEGFKCLHYRK